MVFLSAQLQSMKCFIFFKFNTLENILYLWIDIKAISFAKIKYSYLERKH